MATPNYYEGDVRGVFCYKYFLWFSIFFILGFMAKEIRKEHIFNKRWSFIYTLLFLVFNTILIQVVPLKVPGFDLLAGVVGCLFIWFVAVNIKSGKMSRYLSFIGKQSLAFYYLNGFALVLLRTFLINVLHVRTEYAIVLLIFIGCLFAESILVLILKRIPFTDLFVGIAK